MTLQDITSQQQFQQNINSIKLRLDETEAIYGGDGNDRTKR
jgi:hypothetical protein